MRRGEGFVLFHVWIQDPASRIRLQRIQDLGVLPVLVVVVWPRNTASEVMRGNERRRGERTTYRTQVQGVTPAVWTAAAAGADLRGGRTVYNVEEEAETRGQEVA